MSKSPRYGRNISEMYRKTRGAWLDPGRETGARANGTPRKTAFAPMSRRVSVRHGTHGAPMNDGRFDCGRPGPSQPSGPSAYGFRAAIAEPPFLERLPARSPGGGHLRWRVRLNEGAIDLWSASGQIRQGWV